jgi:hypothetical protein
MRPTLDAGAHDDESCWAEAQADSINSAIGRRLLTKLGAPRLTGLPISSGIQMPRSPRCTLA